MSLSDAENFTEGQRALKLGEVVGEAAAGKDSRLDAAVRELLAGIGGNR